MKTKTSNNRIAKYAFLMALMVLLPSQFLGVNAHPATSAAADLNLSAEKQALESFGTDWSGYIEQDNKLGKKATLTSAELAALRSSGDGLKRRLSTVQQNLRSFISKLKAARRWDNFDQEVLAGTSDARLRSLLQEEGGAKRIWEDLAANINNLGREIDTRAQNLSNKVRAQSLTNAAELQERAVRVAYQPVAVFARSLRCRFNIAIATVDHAIDGDVTDRRIKKLIEACDTAAASAQ